MVKKFFNSKTELENARQRVLDDRLRFDAQDQEKLSNAISKQTDIRHCYKKIVDDIYDDISELRYKKTQILISATSSEPIFFEESQSIQKKIKSIDEQIDSLHKILEAEKPEVKLQEIETRITVLKQRLVPRQHLILG